MRMDTHSYRLKQRQDDLAREMDEPIADMEQRRRAADFDYRRRVVDDIENMLMRAGAFSTEVYITDGEGAPEQRCPDVEDTCNRDKLRRMAEAIVDYWSK